MDGTIHLAPERDRRRAAARVWAPRDAWVMAGLFLAAILTRLPFTGQILYHWDSINFALGIERFEVAAGQPHVPGYILYILLGKIVNLLVSSPPAALLVLSLIGSGLAVAFLYLLGRELFNRTTGLVAALFLGSSPLFWFYGEIALPHAFDTFAVILAAWLLVKVSQGEQRWAIPAAAWLAIAGGFRPQTQVFLLPLAIFAARRLGWQRILASLVIMLIIDLAWFLPLISLTGGLARYLEVFTSFSADFNAMSSIFDAGATGLIRNLRKLGMYTGYAWGLASPLALFWAFSELRQALSMGLRAWFSSAWRDHRVWIFALWLLPTLGYYVFIHMGQQGLVFVFLPALLLISALGASRLLESRARLVGQFAVAVVFVVNALVFLVAPTYPLGGATVKLLTRDTLRRHDQFYETRLSAVRENFPAENTLLLSSQWRFPQYYLSEYPLAEYTLGARWEAGEGLPVDEEARTILPAQLGLQPAKDGAIYLVLFDDDLLPFSADPSRRENLALADGTHLTYLRLRAGESLYLSPAAFQIQAAGAP